MKDFFKGLTEIEIGFLLNQLIFPFLATIFALVVGAVISTADEAVAPLAGGTLVLISALAFFSLGQHLLSSSSKNNMSHAKVSEKIMLFFGVFFLLVYCTLQVAIIYGQEPYVLYTITFCSLYIFYVSIKGVLDLLVKYRGVL
jgi:hypothetical protein